jgi:hypothetical protein
VDDNDIIIVIVEHLRLNSKDGEIAITPAELDDHLKLPTGSVEKHLDEVLKDARMIVVRKGATRISLRKGTPPTTWVSK